MHASGMSHIKMTYAQKYSIDIANWKSDKRAREDQQRILEDVYVIEDISVDVAICYHTNVLKDASENEREENLCTHIF
jgi:hypothetical protein